MKETSGANSAGTLSHLRLRLNKRCDLPIKKAFTLIVLKQDLNTSYSSSPPNAQSAHKCESGRVKLLENEKTAGGGGGRLLVFCFCRLMSATRCQCFKGEGEHAAVKV